MKREPNKTRPEHPSTVEIKDWLAFVALQKQQQQQQQKQRQSIISNHTKCCNMTGHMTCE
jgi:hypothetical protein